MKPEAYRPKAAARELGISESSVYRRLRDGTLRRVKVGGATLIPIDEIRRVLKVNDDSTRAPAA